MPAGQSLLDRKMKKSSSRAGIVAFLLALTGGLAYIAFHVAKDLDNVAITSIWPYMLLALALLIALGFEFVNGFHDTANAVATVIYTHSLEPNIAVVWFGLCNLAGVLASTGTVAFAVITLLPVSPFCGLAPEPASPWSLPFSSPPSCGIWAHGGSVSRHPVRTRWWAPSLAWALPISS